jgi:hypothetical protein
MSKDKPAGDGKDKDKDKLRGKFPPRAAKPARDDPGEKAKGFLDKILGRGKDSTKFGWSEFSSLTDD